MGSVCGNGANKDGLFALMRGRVAVVRGLNVELEPAGYV